MRRLLAAALALSASAAAPEPPYVRTGAVALGAPDRWDYLTYDPALGRVFAAHGDRVTVVDARTRAVVGEVKVGDGAHGVVIAGGKGFAASGKAGMVTVFDAATLAPLGVAKAGADADSMISDPSSGRVFVANGDSGSVTVVDAARGVASAVIDVGGSLESAAADGAGRVFVNVADRREIAVIDAASAKVVARWPAPDCVSPHGLAYDPASRRLFATCVDGRMAGFDAADGRRTSTTDIGRGSDAAAFDPATHRLFSSNNDGTLDVFEVGPDGEPHPVSRVSTAAGARTLAVAPGGPVFLVTADTDGQQQPNGRWKFVPGTVKLLIYEPAP